MSFSMQNQTDGGLSPDWGAAAEEYVRYRDIYPASVAEALLEEGFCKKGTRVLDLGTGTGVLPRMMAPYGAVFVGVDESEGQVQQARRLAKEAGLAVEFIRAPVEALCIGENTFDNATALQCFQYFNLPRLLPALAGWLRPGGGLAVLYMMWLPKEDAAAAASEELVLHYNPGWAGGGWQRGAPVEERPTGPWFSLEKERRMEALLPFTPESWTGRMLACRGVGATLPEKQKKAFREEHLTLFRGKAEFTVRHEIILLVYRSLKP